MSDRIAFPRLVVLSKEKVDPDKQLCRPLYGRREANEPDRPWVAVATGREGGAFVLAERSGGKALVDQATATLNHCPHKWTVSETKGALFWKRPSLLRAYGDLGVPVTEMATEGAGIDDLSTDLILREDVMAEAEGLLKSQNLLVVVPKRGWLMVSAGKPGEFPAMLPMHKIADGIAERGGRDGITKLVFFYGGGSLTGWSQLADGKGSLSLTVRADDDPWGLAAASS